MFDEKDLLIDARHVTRRFPTNDGRMLTACDDINLKFYKGNTHAHTTNSDGRVPPEESMKRTCGLRVICATSDPWRSR